MILLPSILSCYWLNVCRESRQILKSIIMEKKSIVNRVIRWTPRIIIMIFFGILAWNEIVPKGKGDNLLFGVGF